MNIEFLISEQLRRFSFLRNIVKLIYQATFFLLDVLTGRFFRLKTNCPYYELPANCFFGYYDKSPWNKKNTEILCQQIQSDGSVAICIYNISDATLKKIAETSAFSYQQGSMLQWLESNVIFNIVDGDKYKSQILDRNGNVLNTFPSAVYAVSEILMKAIGFNFEYLYNYAKPYGYKKLSNKKEICKEPELTLIDLTTGKEVVLFKLSDIVMFNNPNRDIESEHYINHIEFSPEGKRIVFYHRCKIKKREVTRMIVSDIDGENMVVVADFATISHYTWLNEDEIMAWAILDGVGDFYLFDISKGKRKHFSDRLFPYDGHPSFSKDKKWLFFDSYPNKRRVQDLYAYNISGKKIYNIAKLYHPFKYGELTRCDLHPRYNSYTKELIVDTVYSGRRTMLCFNIKNITDNETISI